ncbi:hypothetical protein UF10_00250 [Peptostreptococcus russellii]|uniref:Alkaline shock response membrane anchor protein AmaP n=1 Tax=Peptostreptococcus russellii TaxID=215200 RepID=A0A2P7Q2P0_9FIRM|nr:alkaline shock response membrane anchor protein AmaP [Peptostreptococcus russellii]PSJ32233.1 hypothetical protein UF10_00250 [Peptostreptococcus russellii]
MSRFKKLLNIVYYLIVVIFVITFLLSVNKVSWFVDMDLQSYLLDDRVKLGITVIGSIILVILSVKIIVTIFKKNDDRYLILFEKGGNISISDTVIEKTVINTLKEFEEVIECTAKVKIKNKNSGDSKVKLNIKCGLDEAVCRAKGYYDFDEKSENSNENISKSTKKSKKSISKEVGKDNNTELASEVKKVEKEGNTELASEVKEIGKDDNTELASEVKEVEKEDKTELASEIKEAREVISEDKKDSEILGLENKKVELSESNKKRISSMGIDDLCNTIQVRIHNSLEDFLAQKVDKVNIKFYDVEVKEKKIDLENSKQNNKVGLAKDNKKNKNKRVN